MTRAAALVLAALPLAAAAQSPPSLLGVAARITGPGAAVISWTTDQPSDGEVDHGPTFAYGVTVASSAPLGTAHEVALNGLGAGLRHFRVKSRNAHGALSVSGDFTFTTAAGAPPEISTGPGSFPIVVIMNPQMGALLSGSVTVSANATAGSGVASVQFLLDGGNLGPAMTAGPFTFLWHTPAIPDGPHTLAAVAADAAGRSATSPILAITVDNVPPVITEAAATAVSADAAVIVWTSNERADSQVEYGTTTAYALSSPPNASLVVRRGVALSGLAPNTVYHFRVKSRDAAGLQTVSGDATFTTAKTQGGIGAAPVTAAAPPARAPQKILTPARIDGYNDKAVFGPEAQEVSIMDLRGRRVFRETRSGAPIEWNCRDGSGNFVASGVYIARIKTRDSKDVYQTFAVAK